MKDSNGKKENSAFSLKKITRTFSLLHALKDNNGTKENSAFSLNKRTRTGPNKIPSNLSGDF